MLLSRRSPRLSTASKLVNVGHEISQIQFLSRATACRRSFAVCGYLGHLKTKREAALRTPGLTWADEDPFSPPRTVVGGRETRKMNTYQAIRDAMSIALAKDDTAVVFGEDVALRGVFRCTMASILFSKLYKGQSQYFI